MNVRLQRFTSVPVLTLLVICFALPTLAQERRVVTVEGTPKGLPFSDGIIAGNSLYIAGQQGTDQNGKLPAGGTGPETQATLENIAKIVKTAGFDLKDIVAVNVYLADIHEFAIMNQVYKSFMPDPKPTRTTVQVSGLVNNARIEISAIAIKRP